MNSAATDDELHDWLRRMSEDGSNFVRAVVEAAFLADTRAYTMLRPLLVQLKEAKSRSDPSVVVDCEEQKSHDPSGPHIRCKLCGWSPGFPVCTI